MLVSLSISNIVLIRHLNLEFGAGLNILTGETGAGKSILMDALALALGARGDAGLVRHGCDMASVTAEFDSAPIAVRTILADNGIDYDGGAIIMRRTITSDAKGRAWINDTPVSVRVLRAVGDAIVEIHGQFANHALLNPAAHRPTLDEFGCTVIDNYGAVSDAVRKSYIEYNNAQKRLDELNEMLARSEIEREFLEHNVAELRALNVQPGEEDELATIRARMMNAEKDAATLTDAIGTLIPNGRGLDEVLFDAAHILERIKTDPNPYADQIDKLYSAADIVATVTDELRPTDMDTASLDSVEERLFAIRAAARKHRVHADELPATLEKMAAQLDAIENSDAELKKLQTTVGKCRAAFEQNANGLSKLRHMAADKLREKIVAELPDLKLGGADVMVEITSTTPSSFGCDDVTFMIKTNPGTPFAPLHKSASGGELARFMLALRVVLAGADTDHVFVFDEVDTGISGATASAVGARLGRLAHGAQALVITHSAQVAGFADRHYKISKHIDGDTTVTSVDEITGDAHIAEIARIISGAEITPESLATAKTLLKN